jgi:hypothetical protein
MQERGQKVRLLQALRGFWRVGEGYLTKQRPGLAKECLLAATGENSGRSHLQSNLGDQMWDTGRADFC